MAKSIVVTGDVVTDFHFLRREKLPYDYSSPAPGKKHFMQPGGAWFVHRIAKLALKDLTDAGKCRLLGPACNEGDPRIAIAHSVWSEFPERKGAKKNVWRVSEFLGCENPPDLAAAAPVNTVADDGSGHLDPASSIFVFDDLGVGFQSHDNLWPEAIRTGKEVAAIVLKTGDFSRDNLLLNHLLDKYADHLTLVIGADALRERGAAMSKGLSWDRTIEEIVCEFETGLSSCDLARAGRVVIHFDGGSAAASFTRFHLKIGPSSTKQDSPVHDRVCFERFLYLPDEVEGVWSSHRQGTMFGRGSIITASVVRHLAEPESYPLFIALGRGLAAGRHNAERGGGYISASEPDVDEFGISCRLQWRKPAVDSTSSKTNEEWEEETKIAAMWPPEDPSYDYSTAFPHQVLTDPVWRHEPASKSNLLKDAVGPELAYYVSVAMDVVVRGPEKGLLRTVPKARYGDYMTVDREEIERINALRGLIDSYRRSPKDKRPLSIAVFGPPGSGKSFAIKQLAAAMFGKDQKEMEFNLSQFADADMSQLHSAFHRVRDASIKGSIPLVFWDEFDSDDLKWLKHFLAPMQDCEFRSGSDTHPFGKAIFIFAGGTRSTFEAFDRSNDQNADIEAHFRARKGPDFVSRLRGFVNIKGPNPIDIDQPDEDPEYIIRRAMIFRSLLQRHFGHLIDASEIASVSSRVIRAFLTAKRFLHGARSMEAALSMSNLRQALSFDVAELTTPELLGLHVTEDFVQIANDAEIESEITEALGKAFHDGWRKIRMEDGWKFGEPRDDVKKLHPLIKDFEQLTAEQQRMNYDPAIVTPAKLAQLGYRIRRRRATRLPSTPVGPFTGNEFRRLLEIEHDIWIRNHMMQGFEYADNATDYALRRHRDIAVFAEVPEEDQRLDAANIEEIAVTLHQYGYELVKV